MTNAKNTQAASEGNKVSFRDSMSEEPPQTKKPDLNFLFYWWLVFVALIFAVLAGLFLWAQERLLSKDEKPKFLIYVLTVILAYGYMRMIMHIVTKAALTKFSEIYATMPFSLQEDCAYRTIDALSGILWMPLVMYGVVKVFCIRDNEEFFEQVGPLMYVTLGAYHVDRILQLIVSFRMDSLLHHMATCIWTLLVLEWLPNGRDATIFCGAIIEAGSKPLHYWVASARFSRRHLRGGPHNTENTNLGIDRFYLVGSTPKKLACIAKFFRTYFYMAFCGGPAAFLVFYLTVFDTSLFSKAFAPIAFVMFLGVDYSWFKAVNQNSKEDYWKNTVLKNQTLSRASSSRTIDEEDSSMEEV